MVLQNEYKRAASARHRGRGRGQGQPAPHSPAAHRLVKNEFPDLVSASASASSQPSSSPATDPGGDDDTEHSFKFSRRELRDNANRYDEPAQQLEDGPAVEGDGGWESKVIVEQTEQEYAAFFAKQHAKNEVAATLPSVDDKLDEDLRYAYLYSKQRAGKLRMPVPLVQAKNPLVEETAPVRGSRGSRSSKTSHTRSCEQLQGGISARQRSPSFLHPASSDLDDFFDELRLQDLT